MQSLYCPARGKKFSSCRRRALCVDDSSAMAPGRRGQPPMPAMTLDRIDLRLIELLQHDATLPVTELAERVSLTPTPCWKRIQRLKKSGVIRAEVALCDPRKLGFSLDAFVAVRTARHDWDWAESFAAIVATVPEIVAAHRLSGEIDYLLRIVAADMADFDRIYKKLIAALPFSDLSSSFAMETLKESSAVPLTAGAIARLAG